MFGCDLNVSIVFVDGPNETVVVGPTCMEGNGLIGNTTLPSSGTYRIVVDPVSFVAGTVTLTLNDVTVPEPVSIAAAAAPMSVLLAPSAEVTLSGAQHQTTQSLSPPTGSSTAFHPINRGDAFTDIAEALIGTRPPRHLCVTETSLIPVNLSRAAASGVGPNAISP